MLGPDGRPTFVTKPTDPNALATAIVAEATEGRPAGETDDTPGKKNPAAVALGRLGGKKGGPARAAKMTPKERSKAALKAAKARWAKEKGTKGITPPRPPKKRKRSK